MDGLQYTFRSLKPEDEPFIYRSFLKSLYQQSPYNMIDSKVFFGGFHKQMEVFLADPEATVRICCEVDDSNSILGFAIGTADNNLVYVYVKQVYRHLGIGAALVNQVVGITAPIKTTFATPAIQGLLRKLHTQY